MDTFAKRHAPSWRGLAVGLFAVLGCSGPEATPGQPKETPVPPDVCAFDTAEVGTVDFFSDVLPIIGDRCVRCHGGVRELGVPALNLQTREQAAFVLGQKDAPCSSELFRRVASPDPENRMPLGQEALPPDKVAVLRRWIAQGAPWPKHWSFVPLAGVLPNAIPVRNTAWVKTPIDRFIISRLEGAGIAPSPEADRTTLLRRLSFDLNNACNEASGCIIVTGVRDCVQ
jgi:hypothetical protein